MPKYIQKANSTGEFVITCEHAGAHKAREISELRAELNSIKAMLI